MRYLLFILLISLGVSTTHAGVTIDGTRIVFPSNSNSVGVQINNAFDSPALVQAWIDKEGEENPDAENIPFILTPSLSRVEPKKGQVIRIIPTEVSQLAQDRESLFWFNLLDIPPDDPSLVGQNILAFTVRSRIKLFYRPSKLKTTPNEAFEKITFSYLAQDGHVVVNNPTPFYITFAKIAFATAQGDQTYPETSMLAPFTQQTLVDLNLKSKPNNVQYSVVNDLGGTQNFSTSVH